MQNYLFKNSYDYIYGNSFYKFSRELKIKLPSTDIAVIVIV